MDVAAFVLARLDEDEQAARVVHKQSWTLTDGWLDGPGFAVIASVDPATMDPAERGASWPGW